MIKFQKLVYDTQKLFESSSVEEAVLDGKKWILFDRGVIDAAAYLKGGASEYKSIFKRSIKDDYERYDFVIFLDIPSKDIYEANKSNNPARSEPYELACEVNDKLKSAWQNHPNFIFIRNDGGWDAKVVRVKETISDILKRASK